MSNFMDESCVQVALFEDRLEVTSPGGLCYGLTLQEALQGRSRQRNRVVANIFNQMGLIEAWGNGLRSIIESAKQYKLPKPDFIAMPETFRVILYRLKSCRTKQKGTEEIKKMSYGTESKNLSAKQKKTQILYNLSDAQKKIIELMKANPQITGSELSESVGIAKRNIESNVKKLKEQGVLERVGTAKNGIWKVKL